MVHVVIQIPCFNEAEHLHYVLEALPTRLEGVKTLSWLVIDDGSSDATASIAERYGCHVISHKENLGLSSAFRSGVKTALGMGADIVVNIDGDNQYRTEHIPELIAPILAGQADMVIGNRDIKRIPHFSLMKKFLQVIGSYTVRFITKTDVPDTVSGYRAYAKESLLKLSITSQFSYVLDTLVQAKKKGLKIQNISVEVNPPTRESRLARGMFDHIKRSLVDLFRVFLMYQPMKFFIYLAITPILLAVLIMIRYLYFYVTGDGSGHIQSLIGAIILFLLGLHFVTMGIIGDIIAKNRWLMEESLYLQKKRTYSDHGKRHEG